MKRLRSYLIVAACLGLASCNQMPACGSNPSKPKVVRDAAFFGRVTADPRGWTVGPIGRPGFADAHLVVGGRPFTTDAQTERLGYCGPAFARRRCAAFVGMRRPGVAAWVLLAQPQDPRFVPPIERGRLEVIGVIVWSVQTTSIVLSQGVELRLGPTFAPTRQRLGYGLRGSLVGRQVDPSLYVDPRNGEVLDLQFSGCV